MLESVAGCGKHPKTHGRLRTSTVVVLSLWRVTPDDQDSPNVRLLPLESI